MVTKIIHDSDTYGILANLHDMYDDSWLEPYISFVLSMIAELVGDDD